MRDFTLRFSDRADFRAFLRKLNWEEDEELQNAVLVDEIGFTFRETDVSDDGEPEYTRNEGLNRPGFPGECFICELRLPDHRFRWKHNKLFLLLPEEYGPAFPAIVDCYTSPPT